MSSFVIVSQLENFAAFSALLVVWIVFTSCFCSAAEETAEPKDCLNGIVDWPKEEDSGSSAGLFPEDLTESAVELYARAQELCNSNAVHTSAVHRY